MGLTMIEHCQNARATYLYLYICGLRRHFSPPLSFAVRIKGKKRARAKGQTTKAEAVMTSAMNVG